MKCRRPYCRCAHEPPCVGGYIDELEHDTLKHGQRYATAVPCPTCHPGSTDLDLMRAELDLNPDRVRVTRSGPVDIDAEIDLWAKVRAAHAEAMAAGDKRPFQLWMDQEGLRP